MNEETLAWLVLLSLPTVGPVRVRQLIDAGFSVEDILQPEHCRDIPLTKRACDALAQYHRGQNHWLQEQVEKVIRWQAGGDNRHLISLHSENYPSLLKEIADPPPVLFVEGDFEVLHRPQLAMVGSRKASRNGMVHAKRFSASLSQSGFIVTSGLAHGIDAAAHTAAVECQQPTIAVFGTGLQQVYPRQNQRLAESILAGGGCWVSECWPDAAPHASHFPRRNRIISGLSIGVLVVEASPRSGSLITARLANEQGREVFAIPGPIDHPSSRGCHQLIREGATLVETTEQIVEQLGSLLALSVTEPADQAITDAIDPHLSELSTEQQWLLDRVGFEGVTFEDLLLGSSQESAVLSALVVELELLGLVERSGEHLHRLVVR